MAAVIALTTDFGLSDPYVGVMKGVILGICPGATLVDLTHGIEPQDVLGAALALEGARPYFPKGTVHVAVVDPGVGTEREAVAVSTKRDLFVAPDNGLLSFLPDDELREVRAIRNSSLMLHPLSRTFHGRDVFAPVAAHLASGVPLSEVGPPLPGLRRLELPRATRSAGETVGEILAFDRFGNAVTSIREADLPSGELEVRVGKLLLPLVSTYAVVAAGTPLALVGSTGRLEICVSDGSARDVLALGRGEVVAVRAR